MKDFNREKLKVVKEYFREFLTGTDYFFKWVIYFLLSQVLPIYELM